jgi:asparagine synthase (glutamine-hydrolysing)
MTAQSSRAVLSGEGADELFGGYREYRAEGLTRMVPPHFLAAAAAMAGWLPSGDSRLSPGDVARRLSAGALDAGAPHAWRWRRCVAEHDIDEVFMPGTFGSEPPPAFPAGPDPGATDLLTLLPDMLLPKADRIGLSCGVEVRVPYLDGSVVVLARRGGFSPGKKLLRAACEGVLPPEVVHGKKRGFSAPVRAWLRSRGARGEAREFLLGAGAKLAPRLNAETLDAWLSQHGAHRRDRSREVHALLALESWFRRSS